VLHRVARRNPMLTGLGNRARHALAISLGVVTLIALAIVDNVWSPVTQDKVSSRVTVIYKNQVYPSIGELKARAAVADHSGRPNSDKGLVFHRRGQWI
jgi:hypothetical protein